MNRKIIAVFILIIITIALFVFAFRNQIKINATWRKIKGTVTKVTCGQENVETTCKTYENDIQTRKKNPWRNFNDQYHNINTTTIIRYSNANERECPQLAYYKKNLEVI